MLKDSNAYSGFSVDNLETAKEFYGGTLGLEIKDEEMGLVIIIPGNQNGIFVYPKESHESASYTILNFPVDDISKAVEELKNKGVVFEIYEGLTDENGIAWGRKQNRGPDIAWFKDPAGNIMSVLN